MARMENAAELLKENILLKQKLSEQESQIQQKNNQLQQKNDYIIQLEELLKLTQSRQFSPSSEKVSPHQLSLFNEPADDEDRTESNGEDEKTTTVKTHSGQKKPRISIPDHYPREDIIYDLLDDEKICPHDGTALNLIDHEDHEQLDIIPAQIRVLRHRRLKYACPCCEQYVVTARKPKQPIEKSIASANLLAQIAIQKYCDALPLYRQSQIYHRLGIHIDRTNLANWMVRCGELIQPVINLLLEQLHKAACLQMDETALQVLNEVGKAAQSQSYMWVMASQDEHPIRLFHYAPTRSQSVPLSLLSSDTPALMADGYEGYQAACDQYAIVRLGCMAHARRKFVEAQKIQPKGKSGKADMALSHFAKLYEIERKAKDLSADERYRLRQEKAKPIIDKLRVWLEKSLPQVPPKTALGKALSYLHRQWDRLIRYLDDGHYPIDNNRAENAIRPFVIGRKNWLFSASEAGAKASANLYSLIETAKANQLNPQSYLKLVFEKLPNAKNIEDVENLLPWKADLG